MSTKDNDYVTDPLLQAHKTFCKARNTTSTSSTVTDTTHRVKVVDGSSSSPASRTTAAVPTKTTACNSSIRCSHCGKCRCEQCTKPRTLPQTPLCCGRITCSPHTVVEMCTCISAVRCLFFHGLENDSDADDEDYVNDRVAQKPCACFSQPYCCQRWTCLSALAVTVLPCLWFYWPLKGCLHAAECLHDRCQRPGCRCKPDYSSPSRQTSNSSSSDAAMLQSSASPSMHSADEDDTTEMRLSTSTVGGSTVLQPPPVPPRESPPSQTGQLPPSTARLLPIRNKCLSPSPLNPVDLTSSLSPTMHLDICSAEAAPARPPPRIVPRTTKSPRIFSICRSTPRDTKSYATSPATLEFSQRQKKPPLPPKKTFPSPSPIDVNCDAYTEIWNTSSSSPMQSVSVSTAPSLIPEVPAQCTPYRLLTT